MRHIRFLKLKFLSAWRWLHFAGRWLPTAKPAAGLSASPGVRIAVSHRLFVVVFFLRSDTRSTGVSNADAAPVRNRVERTGAAYVNSVDFAYAHGKHSQRVSGPVAIASLVSLRSLRNTNLNRLSLGIPGVTMTRAKRRTMRCRPWQPP
jgi:hypothetical protein